MSTCFDKTTWSTGDSQNKGLKPKNAKELPDKKAKFLSGENIYPEEIQDNFFEEKFERLHV